MPFIADLHIHSKFSRATAKDLDLENLHVTAQKKGITVVGTGDFTHPGWYSEIKEKLVPAEEGLFKLKEGIRAHLDQHVRPACREKVRFILGAEISNIYKKNGKTRKIHNLVFFPEMDSVEKFNRILEKIGNIKSDGRPILGLDAKNLLEIVLETSSRAFLIPAHIWTPWFSILGSKSGFDSIEECFEDLTPYIFALETGLSSDPSMNWRISGLDGFTLVSNSDAHSPSKLGREANLLNTELSYSAIKSALRSGDPERYLGTFEFYPEEGKYHLDGHRKCNVRLWPQKTREAGGICPICKRPLTLGVLYRVQELADRPEGVKPKRSHPYYKIIPLTEILSEILMVGSGSQKVRNNFDRLIEKFGPEFRILHSLELELFENSGLPLLGEAIKRMRCGNIDLSPGYDGEFGKIKIFSPAERENLLGQSPLFSLPIPGSHYNTGRLENFRCFDPKISREIPQIAKGRKEEGASREMGAADQNDIPGPSVKLNLEQQLAVRHSAGPLLIVAGPGTGKTLTLTHRIAHLVSQYHISPRNILALTFTQHAAREMHQRLRMLLPDIKPLPLATTFHSFCFQILKKNETTSTPFTIIDDYEQTYFLQKALAVLKQDGIHISLKAPKILDKIISAKQHLLEPHDNLESVLIKPEAENIAIVYQAYQKLLSVLGHYDYDDLIFRTVSLLETDRAFKIKYRDRFQYILVDEYQDLNHGQYRIIRALSPTGKNLFVIGDPDQSIYGFRGSEVRYFKRFLQDYPDAEIISLKQNYRSTQTILDASFQVISASGSGTEVESRVISKIKGVKKLSIIEAISDKAEAVSIGQCVEKMVGGIGFYSIDFDRIDGTEEDVSRSFSDFAVLYRTRDQGDIIADIFHKAGIPCQVASRNNALYKKGMAEIISFLKVIEGIGSYPDLERIIDLTGIEIDVKYLDRFSAWGLRNGLPLSKALQNIRHFTVERIKEDVRFKFDEFLRKLSAMKTQMQNMDFEKKTEYILDNPLLPLAEKRKENLKTASGQIFGIMRKFRSRNLEFLSRIALETDTDIYNPLSEKVTLLTMHAAKGLEFPVVFISGCEKGFIPFQRPNGKTADLNEERRLFYVAMTRAKKRLFLTYAKKRIIHGHSLTREISPFVKDIEKKLRQHETPYIYQTNTEPAVQLKLF